MRIDPGTLHDLFLNLMASGIWDAVKALLEFIRGVRGSRKPQRAAMTLTISERTTTGERVLSLEGCTEELAREAITEFLGSSDSAAARSPLGGHEGARPTAITSLDDQGTP